MRLLIVLINLLLFLHSAAQEPVPFPTSNASWRNLSFGFSGGPFEPPSNFLIEGSPLFSYNEQDTLVDDIVYAQLIMDSLSYVGGIRTEDRVVYILPVNETEEYLLYDFSAESGDTLHDVFISDIGGSSGFELVDMLIEQTDSVMLLSGVYHKRMILQDGSRWIDGIGNVWGLLWPSNENVSNYDHMLARFCKSDSIQYEGNVWGGFTFEDSSCGASLNSPSGIGEFSFNGTLTVYPNPTTGVLRVTLPSRLYLDIAQQPPLDVRSGGIQLFDALGREIPDARFKVQAAIDSETLLLDIAALPKGLYVLRLTSAYGVYSARILKE
jgi:hypothetical protein